MRQVLRFFRGVRYTVMTMSGHIMAQSVHPVHLFSGSTKIDGRYPLTLK